MLKVEFQKWLFLKIIRGKIEKNHSFLYKSFMKLPIFPHLHFHDWIFLLHIKHIG